MKSTEAGSPHAGGKLWRVWAPLAIIVIGVILRVAWMQLPSSPALSAGEASNVARTFARTGVVGDAFFHGAGPTAHVMPVAPVIAGLVYRAFGVESVLSEAILTAWSLLLVFAAFWMLFRSFELAGSPLLARLGALATLCVLPLNFSLEAVWFRTWDGGLAAAGGAAFLLVLLRLDRKAQISVRDIAGTGLLAAALLFVSPPLGVAAYACGLVLLVTRLPLRRWGAAFGIVIAAMVIVLSPWAIRNAMVMGSPILLRDNFGLEFAQGNYEAAVTNPDRSAQFRARRKEIHPYENPPAIAKMMASGGEVAYSKALEAETKAWVAENPTGFAALVVRHLTEFLFPPAWYWTAYGEAGRGTIVKVALNWAFTALGLIGLAVGLVRRFPTYRYLALMTLLPILPYLLVQPIIRYRYIVLGLLVFLSWDLTVRLLNGARHRFGRKA